MKKLLSIAMLCSIAFIAVSFSFCTAQTPKANLKTSLDSLSYTYGINVTQGLDQYMAQMGIDEANKAEVIKGFLEGVKAKEDDKVEAAHFFGVSIGRQAATQMLPGINKQLFGGDEALSLEKNQFVAGFIAAFLDTNLVINKENAAIIAESLATKVRATAGEKLKVKNQAYLDENKKKSDVITLPSGLQYKVVSEGTGSKPTAEDVVKVIYVGTTIDGKEFDNSKNSQDGSGTAQFGLNQVIPGWTEGIQLMSIGSKYILYVPYDLAYGENGYRGKIDPYATLIFEVELLDIVKQDTPK